MATLVQSYHQTRTTTMLQARPASAAGMIPSQGQSTSQYNPAQPRSTYYGKSNGPVVYRAANAPIQPYAFTSTPSLNTNPHQRQQQTSSNTVRQSSAPTLPKLQNFDSTINLSRSGHQTVNVNVPSGTPGTASKYANGSRDDSSLPTQGTRRVPATARPQSAYMASTTSQTFSSNTNVPSSRERYRRPAVRSTSESTLPAQAQQQPKQTYAQVLSAAPSGSGMASIGHLYATEQPQTQKQSSDDMQLYRQNQENGMRMRRRSMPSLDAADHATVADLAKSRSADNKHRGGSSESVVSNQNSGSRPSSTKRSSSNPTVPTTSPASVNTITEKESVDKNFPKLVNIPPRGSSDAANRLGNPPVLPMPASVMDAVDRNGTSASAGNAPTNKPASPMAHHTALNRSNGDDTASVSSKTPSHMESPAMRHLSAINQKGKNRSKTSRLRRAFSFGSAAEFKHSAENSGAPVTTNTATTTTTAPMAAPSAAPNKLQKEPTSEELYDAEQARIAQLQEEAGIGSNIYAGARIFAGSSDNLSISSTASSASIMIRKMGRGMKKSTRSLVGLFRPKSIVDVPISEPRLPETRATTSTSAVAATVSMVTVEADREHERVNVTPDVRANGGAGTGFPRLERNSLDASRSSSTSDRLSSSGTDNSGRKSIVGGEKERAEVLAAVRKGILKSRLVAPDSGSSSPTRGLELQTPPNISDSPASSAPSTPKDDPQGHKRTGSVTIGGEDYFVSALRLRQDSNKSGSSTPQGSMKRCATFSPRIVFYDTWPSQEYDRRGEIATCNRLTPMLAQQIKEELNSFKMEMEVHETSKIYTHFF